MKISLGRSVLAIKSDAQISVEDNNINTIIWYDGNPTGITNKQILDKQKELQQLEDIYDNRRKEYGTIIDQLDEIYHQGLDSWKQRISSIKAKYPKE